MSSAPFPKISVDVQHVAPSDPSLPSLAVQVTRLVDSYMLWVGINEDLPEDVQSAPSKGNLGRDWACAMPSTNVCNVTRGVHRCSHPPANLTSRMCLRPAPHCSELRARTLHYPWPNASVNDFAARSRAPRLMRGRMMPCFLHSSLRSWWAGRVMVSSAVQEANLFVCRRPACFPFHGERASVAARGREGVGG